MNIIFVWLEENKTMRKSVDLNEKEKRGYFKKLHLWNWWI